jgi:hypothetical protein
VDLLIPKPFELKKILGALADLCRGDWGKKFVVPVKEG